MLSYLVGPGAGDDWVHCLLVSSAATAALVRSSSSSAAESAAQLNSEQLDSNSNCAPNLRVLSTYRTGACTFLQSCGSFYIFGCPSAG